MAKQYKQFSEKEKAAFNFGRGSVAPTSAKGREKFVRALFKNDASMIQSYKNGRAMQSQQKKSYLQKLRERKKQQTGGF